MKCFLGLLLAASVAHADPSPAELAGPPPATANRLASGVMWTTLVPGHGAHPAATDWVTYYGGSSHDTRDSYYLAKEALATSFPPFIDLTKMTVGEKRRYWVPATGASSGHVEDVELIAILGPVSPTTIRPQFPAPSDAATAPNGDRYVVINQARATSAPAEPGDRVFFNAIALDGEGKRVDLGVSPNPQALGDVPVAALAGAIRAMAPGEQRRVWTRRGGKPLWLQITLYSIERRPQVPAPPDVARAPANPPTAPGVQYVVLVPGTGEPPDVADEVTLDYAVWTTAGRTLERSATPPSGQTAGNYIAALAAQLTEMRTGEHRRIWLSPEAAGYLSENGLGAVDPATLAKQVDDMPTTATLSLAQLEARLDDAEAMQYLHAGQLSDAIASATRAVARAPEIDELHAHLAAAYVTAGKPHEAARALAVVAARNPVWTYLLVQEQPDLITLASEPELARLRVRSPANIDLTRMPVLVERSGRFLAVPVEEGSWGSGDSETRIEVFQIATGTIVTTIHGVMWSYMSQPMTPQIDAEVARRRHQVERWLAELGFTGAPGLERGTIKHRDSDDATTTTFHKARITVNEAGEVVRGATVLGHAPGVYGKLHDAYWLPAQRVLVYHWGRAGHEGCEGTDPQGIEIAELR